MFVILLCLSSCLQWIVVLVSNPCTKIVQKKFKLPFLFISLLLFVCSLFYLFTHRIIYRQTQGKNIEMGKRKEGRLWSFLFSLPMHYHTPTSLPPTNRLAGSYLIPSPASRLPAPFPPTSILAPPGVPNRVYFITQYYIIQKGGG